MNAPLLHLNWADWLNLFQHYLTLSLLAVGGAIATTPDMHRFLVEQEHWLSDTQFNSSIAIAQAAPGPNVMFVALMGWQVGLNGGGTWPAMLGAMLSMLGMLLPSSVLAYLAVRWGHENREMRAVRAFKQGMAPIVVALLVATAWILANANARAASDWRLWLVTGVTTLLVWRTRCHPLWLLALGGTLGGTGLV